MIDTTDEFSGPRIQYLPVTFLHTIEELNRRFWRWLEVDYHQRAHGSLQDQSPAQRVALIGHSMRTLQDIKDLERLFLMRVQRRIRKDATFSLDGKLWEAPPHLRGQMVTVYFDPVHYQRVELWMGQRLMGSAKPCNKNLNATLYSKSSNYEQ